MPFDVYTDLKLRYRLKDGKPDPGFLDENKRDLAAMVNATMATWLQDTRRRRASA
jgi:hypothetical protein